MNRLIKGIHRLSSKESGEIREMFARLARHGQTPETLFITCCDSRLDPILMTGAKPGDLFVVRNMGNFVPAFSTEMPDGTGVAAAVEYAVESLGVGDIVVCGHTDCGSMKALYDPERFVTEHTPHVGEWMKLGDRTQRIVAESYPDLSHDERLEIAFRENVLVQLENLCAYPVVRRGLDAGRLHVHAWFFDIATATIYDYDPATERYVAIRTLGSERR